MEKTKPKKLAARILPTKNQDTQIPVEKLLKSPSKVTNKEWAQHWVNIVVVSKMWKAFIRIVKK